MNRSTAAPSALPGPMPAVLVLAICAAAGPGHAQQQVVVPAAAATADGNSMLWVAGFSRDLRQQTILGSAHLQPLLGRTLRGFAFRRDAGENETYAGGTANLRVLVSTAAAAPLAARRSFAENHGQDVIVAFDGPVTVPTSPVPQAGVAPWDAAHCVEVAFTQSFVYTGGDLCLDVLGTADPNAAVDWWIADGVFEDLQGSAIDIGLGCGPFANALGSWAFVDPRSLLPGATARLWAYGGPGQAMLLFLATDVQAGLAPLAAFGLPGAANCFVHLDPGQIGATAVAFVAPPPAALPPGLGEANHYLSLPSQPWVLGARFGAQWLNLGPGLGFATSNGVRCTVAPALPSLDLALVQGGLHEAQGEVSTHQAHVLQLRFH